MHSQAFVLKSALLLAIGSLVGRVLALLNQTLIARHLGPEGFGVLSLGISVFTLLSVVALFGFKASIPRLVPYHAVKETGRSGAVIGSAFAFALPVSILLAVGALIFREDLFANVFKEPRLALCILILAAGFPLTVATDLMHAVARGLKMPHCQFLLSDMVMPVLRIGIFALFILLASDLLTGAAVGFVAAYAVVGMIMAILLWKKTGKTPVRADRAAFRELFGFCWPMAFSELFLVMVSRTDIYGIGYFLGADDVGVYTAAVTVTAILNQVAMNFGYAFLPVITEEFAKDPGEAARIGNETLKWLCLVVLPLAFAFTVCSGQIVGILFGPSYAKAAPVISILVIGVAINVACTPAGNLLIATGHTVWDMIVSCVPMVLSIVLAVLLIPRWGLYGAAVSTSICLSLKGILSMVVSYTVTGVSLIDRRLVAVVAAAAGGLSGASLLARLTGEFGNAWLELAKNLLVMGSVYITVALLVLTRTNDPIAALLRQKLAPGRSLGG